MIDPMPENTERMGVWDYFVVLRRRWRLVAAAVVLAVLGALGYSFSVTPEYVTSADVLLGPTDADEAVLGGGRTSSDEIATQAHVVTSLPVARLVQKRWSLDQTPDLSRLVSVQAVGTGRILRVTVRDTDPARAADTANTVATAYLQFRQQDSLETYQQALDRLAKEQADIKQQLRRIDGLLASAGTDANGKVGLQSQRRTLLADLAQIGTQQDSLRDSLAGVTAGGALLRDAKVPAVPASPRTVLNGVLAGIFGLLVGGLAALLRDRFDDGVHDEAGVRQALGNALVLGRVPRWPDQDRGHLVTVADPSSAASEEYQRLGVNVRFMLAPIRGERGGVVLVTSGQQSEGKTATAGNLAVAATRLGLRVVLVDADLRRAGIAPLFGLQDSAGLSDLLVSTEPTGEFLVDVGIGPLRLLPAGTIPPNPAALLGSSRMRRVLQDLGGIADLVILDSPSVLVGADTLELANHADMVIVVTRAGVSRRRQLVSVTESLRHVAVSTLGVVYNGVADVGRHSRSDGGRTPRRPRLRQRRPVELAGREQAEQDVTAGPGRKPAPGTIAARLAAGSTD